MSKVLMETDKGQLTIDLFDNDAPMTVENFLKLLATFFHFVSFCLERNTKTEVMGFGYCYQILMFRLDKHYQEIQFHFQRQYLHLQLVYSCYELLESFS